MADTQKGKTQPAPITEYQKLKRQLGHAVLVDAPASGFADELMALDAPAKNMLPEGTVALEVKTVDVNIAWVPQDVPVTVRLYLDQKPIPGASGTFEGGYLKFPIPSGMYKSGASLVAMLRFFVGGWKYQMWATVDGAKHPLSDGKDKNPSSPKDDLFVEGYKLP